MRIAQSLRFAVLGALALAACNDGGGGAAQNTSTNEGTLAYSPPLRIASLSKQALTAQLAASASGQQLLAIAGTPSCGVDFYLLQYATVGGAGETTSASGALMSPSGGGACSGKLPIVEYAHGTATTSGFDIADPTDASNEAWPETILIAALFAAQGFIVVAPNYVGYDVQHVDTLSYHPYLNGTQQARDMIDALAAARTALPALSSGVGDSGRLFLTGYSQGGYVALAANRAMQSAGMTVTAAAPMSGPYATEAFGDAIVFGKVDLGATVFIPLITQSYQHAYANLYSSPADIYETRYAAGIDTLLPNDAPISTLFALGRLPQLALFNSVTPTTGNALLDTTLAVPTNPLFALGFGSADLVRNSVRVAYATDALTAPDGALGDAADAPLSAMATYPLRMDLRRNDMRNWTDPATPLVLCGGHDDPTVFYEINTLAMARFWRAQLAAGLVTIVDADPGPAFSSGGIAAQVATLAATVFATDLAAGVSSPSRYSSDVQTAVIGSFPTYFSLTAAGAAPNSPQGILVAGVAAVAAATVAADYTAAVTRPSQVGSDVSNAVYAQYHASLIPPACTTVARGFFRRFLP